MLFFSWSIEREEHVVV